MRIIYLYQYFSTPRASGGSFPYEMARWMVARGHQVHVVTSDRSSPQSGWTETEEAGVHVHWCRVPYSNQMSYGRRIKAFLQFAWQAARKAASLPGDVVYAGSPPLTIALPAVHAARRKRIPLVFEVCDLWPATAIAAGAVSNPAVIAAARRLERFAYAHAAHIVALSPDTKRGIVAAGQPPQRVSVIPNRVNLSCFSTSDEPGRAFRAKHSWLQDHPLVVYTGTLGLVNGCEYLARLAAEVRRLNGDMRFLLVGDGREAEQVRRTAAALGVLDETFFLQPPVPAQQIPAILSAADITTSTVIDRKALWACSPSKLVDSLAAGRPMAINHEGWIADLLRRHECGLVLDARDHRRAARTLVAAMTDAQWMRRARAAARRTAEAEFDADKLLTRLEAILHDVVPTGGRRLAA